LSPSNGRDHRADPRPLRSSRGLARCDGLDHSANPPSGGAGCVTAAFRVWHDDTLNHDETGDALDQILDAAIARS
jgi:hypothetical protein